MDSPFGFHATSLKHPQDSRTNSTKHLSSNPTSITTMKLFTTLLVLLGGAAIAVADGCGSRQCQCLFEDGSHCCVFGDNAQTPDTSDCTAVCSGASRLLQSGENEPAKCNAGGKFSCVGIITAQGRTPCYNL